MDSTRPPPPLPLQPEDVRAIEAFLATTRGDLEAAVTRLPTYQRVTLRWVARELGTRPDDGGAPLADALRSFQRQRERQNALHEKEALERSIASSSATAEQKAFLAQQVAHLWRLLEALTREA